METFKASARLFKMVREELGFTQKRFARKLGVHQSTISKIEKGIHKPRVALVLQLERITQKSTRELYKLAKKYSPAVNPNIIFNPQNV